MNRWWLAAPAGAVAIAGALAVGTLKAAQVHIVPGPEAAVVNGIRVTQDALPWATTATLHGPNGTVPARLSQGRIVAALQPGTAYRLTVSTGWGLLSQSTSIQFKTLPRLGLAVPPSANNVRGVHLRFNQPITAVSWVLAGKSGQTVLKKPATSVWVPGHLAQGTTVALALSSVKSPFSGTSHRPWTYTVKTAAPLYVLTNPGTWQFGVSRTGPFTLQFNQPVANRSVVAADLKFTPPIQGTLSWQSATTATFTPSQPLGYTQSEVMTLTGGPRGPLGPSGQYLPISAVTRPFVTGSNEKIVVSESLPETLTLYKNGVPIFKTLANTGIPGATTPTGNFYVRNKFVFANMHGTDPNGQPYFSPHVPWVMALFGNVAIHGYVRASYGFPQSVGCIELPVANAAKLYTMVSVGTPVQIVP